MLHSGVYVGISGQLALQRRMDTIAHNVANSSAAGFRAEEIKFETLISQTTADPTAFVSSGQTALSRRAGETVPTGNPLDVAVQGEAWLALQTPIGTVYTRDGRMRMLPTGELQSETGHAVLDEGGAGLLLNPSAGTPKIAPNGTISQNGRPVGRLGLFMIDNAARLSRYDTSGVIPSIPAEPVVDFTSNGVMQGYVERANVNPVMEMTNLIFVSRSFDALTSALSQTENTLRDAVQTLGSSGR